MREWLISVATVLPPQLATVFLAALPITELRASVPIAIGVYHLSALEAFAWSAIGNAIPVPIIVYGFQPLLDAAATRFPRFHVFLEHRLRGLALKHRAAYDRYGSLFLALFVAIPLPGTGVWTASALAVVFGIKPAYAVPAILAGMLAADLIVTLITQGTFGALNFLLG